MNEPRVYKHSPIQMILIVVVLGLIFAAMSFGDEWNDMTYLIPLAILVLISAGVIVTMLQKTIVSEDEISSQNLLGIKTLRWTEINRVSGSGNSIKLHNFDGDVTVVPSPGLPGYEEVIELIGNKRPDLFNPQEYSEMSRGALLFVPLAIVAIMVMGSIATLGFLFLTNPENVTLAVMPLFIIFILAAVFAVASLTQPKSLVLEGKTLSINYFTGQKTLLADEIQSVQFAYQRSRNGKIFFILLHLANRKSIRVSGVNPSLPIAYLVLKNWHKQNK